MKKINLAVIGPRGLVGEELLKLLATKNWLEELTLISTQTKANAAIPFRGKKLPIKTLGQILQKKPQFGAIASLAETLWAKTNLAKIFSSAQFIVDESAAFRLSNDVPLVVPEINGGIISEAPPKLIASPNCTTTVLVMALYPIARLSSLRRVFVASYQASSGAGREARDAFLKEAKAFGLGQKLLKSSAFPEPLAGNLFPQIGSFNEDGFSEEEEKVIKETRKILDRLDLSISATCVRVPVLRGHSLAVWAETEKAIDVGALRKAYGETSGVLVKEPYPTPQTVSCKTPVFVGRLRQDPAFPHGVSLWAVGDNLLKGAAYNVLQIIELLLPHMKTGGSPCSGLPVGRQGQPPLKKP